MFLTHKKIHLFTINDIKLTILDILNEIPLDSLSDIHLILKEKKLKVFYRENAAIIKEHSNLEISENQSLINILESEINVPKHFNQSFGPSFNIYEKRVRLVYMETANGEQVTIRLLSDKKN